MAKRTLTKSDTRLLFIQFLKDNNAYYPFVANLANKRINRTDVFGQFIYSTVGTTISDILNCSVSNNTVQQMISAFTWSNTLQGKSYWYSLHCKWSEYIYHVNRALNYL